MKFARGDIIDGKIGSSYRKARNHWKNFKFEVRVFDSYCSCKTNQDDCVGDVVIHYPVNWGWPFHSLGCLHLGEDGLWGAWNLLYKSEPEMIGWSDFPWL